MLTLQELLEAAKNAKPIPEVKRREIVQGDAKLEAVDALPVKNGTVRLDEDGGFQTLPDGRRLVWSPDTLSMRELPAPIEGRTEDLAKANARFKQSEAIWDSGYPQPVKIADGVELLGDEVLIW